MSHGSNNAGREKPNEQKEVVGYLCVDSPAAGVFDKRYDISLGLMIADILFILLSKFHELNLPDMKERKINKVKWGEK